MPFSTFELAAIARSFNLAPPFRTLSIAHLPWISHMGFLLCLCQQRTVLTQVALIVATTLGMTMKETRSAWCYSWWHCISMSHCRICSSQLSCPGKTKFRSIHSSLWMTFSVNWQRICHNLETLPIFQSKSSLSFANGLFPLLRAMQGPQAVDMSCLVIPLN